LAVDPRDRYQTVGEFWDDLTQALDLTGEVGTVSIRHQQQTFGASGVALDSLAPPASAVVDLTPALAPRRSPAASSATRGSGAISDSAVSVYPRPSIWKALGRAFSFLGVSVVITALDRIVARTTGVPLTLGPVHLSWVAGGFMVVALGMAVAVIKRAMDE
jgi:hypothetical protein